YLLHISYNVCIFQKNVVLQSTECRFNPKHFHTFNLSIIESIIYAEMGTKSKISQGFRIYLNVEMRLQNTKAYKNVFTYNMDICRVLNSLRNNIYNKWFLSILNNGNFSGKCPVPPGYYYLKDLKLDTELLPGFLFSGDYRLQLIGYYGRLTTASEDKFMHC
ncbi:hypothetical protein KR222_006963, partial [Zaprionus bogoriensis]